MNSSVPGTQEAVCANRAYKRHVTAKCHNLDSLAIWRWFLNFLYIRFHNSFSFWVSGLGDKLDQIRNFGPLGCLGALYGHFIWPTLWTLNNAWHVQGHAKYDMWHVTCDTWLVTCGMLQVTCDMWHVTCHIWHMTDWNVTKVECTQYSMHVSMAFPRTCNEWHVICEMHHITCNM